MAVAAAELVFADGCDCTLACSIKVEAYFGVLLGIQGMLCKGQQGREGRVGSSWCWMGELLEKGMIDDELRSHGRRLSLYPRGMRFGTQFGEYRDIALLMPIECLGRGFPSASNRM